MSKLIPKIFVIDEGGISKINGDGIMRIIIKFYEKLF